MAIIVSAHKHEKYSAEKFRELVLYVSAACADDPSFGSTKLNKILYYADFKAYRDLGEPITWADYFKNPNGPCPREFMEEREQLEAEGRFHIQPKSLPNGMTQKRPIADRDPDLTMFSKREKEIVDFVIRTEWGKFAVTVSEESHDINWKVAGHKESIPYESAFFSDPPVSAVEQRRALQIAKRYEKELAAYAAVAATE